MTHTPGPWTIHAEEPQLDEAAPDIFIRAADGTNIASSQPYYPARLDPCNASLIAAAPELLKALIALKDNISGIMEESGGVWGFPLNGAIAEWGGFDDLNEALESAVDAVAKARCES